MTGFRLAPGTTNRLAFSVAIDMSRLARSIHLLIVTGSRLPVEMRTYVYLRTWLGTLRWPVRIAPS